MEQVSHQRSIRATLGSFFGAWTSEAGRRSFTPCFVIAAAATLASLPPLLAQRTHLFEGAGPHDAWHLPLWILAGLVLLVPVAVPREPLTRTWRLAPVLLILAPFVPSVMAGPLVALGLAGVLAWSSRPWARRLAALLAALTVAWLVCGLTAALFVYAEARMTGYALLQWPLAISMNLLGFEVTTSQSFIFVTSEGITERILPSPDKFGGAFPLCLAVSLVALGVLFRMKIRSVVLALAVTVLYVFLRTGWLIGAIIEDGPGVHGWWDEWSVILSYLPLLAVLPLLIRPRTLSDPRRTAQIAGARTWLFPGACAGAFLLCLGWLWVDPGTPKRGTVLFDERYSRWEWSEDPIDDRRFGVKTVYSYYNLANTLDHYFDVERNFDDITDETLAGVSVLVLKTPTAPYPPEVREAIWRFVDNGGGLWLIGDHTNVFGMTSHLNTVAQRYGIVGEYDAVLDPKANRQLYLPARTDHPIVRRMPLFVWMTGNSLRAPWGSRDAILSQRLLCDRPDFSQNTGFGDFGPQLDERVGSVTQAVGLHSGKGRVAAWSDSTVFSNFGVFFPGKMELALGYVDWLNRSNSTWPLRPILMLSGLLLCLLAVPFSRGGLAALGLWSGAGLAAGLMPILYDAQYPSPAPEKPLEYVAFLEPNHKTFHLPVLTTFEDPTADGYLTSFIASQRVGKRPFVARSMDDLEKAGTAVIVHSAHAAWSDPDVSRLLAFVEQGGHLLLLDAGRGDNSLLPRMAARIGLELTPYEYTPPASVRDVMPIMLQYAARREGDHVGVPIGPKLADVNGTELGNAQVPYVISGGEPLIRIKDDPDGVVAVRVRFGRGAIVLTTSSDLFSDETLGESNGIPNARQFAIQRWLFAFYRHVEDPGVDLRIASERQFTAGPSAEQ